jgi:hypothetical protein
MDPLPLGAIAEVFTGLAPKPGTGPRSVGFIQIKDLTRERRSLVRGAKPLVKRAHPVREGDVLLAARGEHNIATVAEGDLIGAYPTLDVYLIRPLPRRLDSHYLAAFLRLPANNRLLKASTSGVLVPRVPKAALEDLVIPLPPLDRQRVLGQWAEAAAREVELTARLDQAQRTLRDRQLAAAFRTLSASL